MKKLISTLLIVVMVLSVFTLAGCNNSESADEDQLTVCVVVSSAFGDKSFNDSAKEGADKLAEDYGVNVTTIECNEENYKQHMMDAAEVSDVVVPVG